MSTHVASIRRRQCAPCAPAWRSSYPTLPRYQLMKCPGPYFYLCFFHSFSSSMPLARLSTASHARCIISLLSSTHTHTYVLTYFSLFFSHTYTHHYFDRIFANHKILGCYSIQKNSSLSGIDSSFFNDFRNYFAVLIKGVVCT